MDVLGVDQSLTMTGVARTVHGMHVSLDRYKTEPQSSVSTRDRVRYIVGSVLRFAPKTCLSVIEQPIIPRHGAGAVLERAWLFGMLVDQLTVRGPVVTVHPSTRAMYAAGSGKADKAAVLAAMRARFPELIIRDDNEADALALLCMGARFLGQPIDGPISKKQEQAMTSTVWPQMKERD